MIIKDKARSINKMWKYKSFMKQDDPDILKKYRGWVKNDLKIYTEIM